MPMNNIRKTVLALIAALAIGANTSQADEGAQAVVPPRPFADLITDDAALQAWWNGTNSLNQPLPEFSFDLPISEAAESTAKHFQNQFDLVVNPADPIAGEVHVKLDLKHVNAIEIFNAMNIYFETCNIPAHWKLTLNGNRPTAILETKKPPPPPAPPAETERKHTVYSIADILYTSGPQLPPVRADEIMDAVSEVLNDTQKPGRAAVHTPGGPEIKIHVEAGLLVFTGTAEETELVYHTLEAMRQTAAQKAVAEMTHKAMENLKNFEPGLRQMPRKPEELKIKAPDDLKK
jgi:hypothetical protein